MPDQLPDRAAIHAHHRMDENELVRSMRADAPTAATRAAITARATTLIDATRAHAKPALMDVFLAEYGLSTEEGVALMCLAEALLRVPDTSTIDALIDDKITQSAWSLHLGQSSSPLVNASTWALMLTGKVLKPSQGVTAPLRSAIRRLGEPVIRSAVARAMEELGAQFVLGETIEAAIKRGKQDRARGYTFSYDMLGEAALTADDAQSYFDAYSHAIAALGQTDPGSDIRDTPGISIKLSALHPRYEYAQRERVMQELVPRVLILAEGAKAAGIGLNIDAEEADRLDLSLDVIQEVLSRDSLSGWEGFGVVVQAYGKRALPVIDWLYTLAERLDRRIMVRLVKGAYWDTEIKAAQVEGLRDYPVFTRKAATDMSFIVCAKRLFAGADRIYPQFATHNAHSMAAILELAGPQTPFEFQKLHGMGTALHEIVREDTQARCRIYAPVGAHRDLLAYLVRRLLENGANSSFVNQIVDQTVPAHAIAADPFEADLSHRPPLVPPHGLFAPGRRNSAGVDLSSAPDLAAFDAARAPFAGQSHLRVGPDAALSTEEDDVPEIVRATKPWAAPTDTRAAVLQRASDLYEQHLGELCAVLAEEAGKTPKDAIGEVREAVDFLRYYAVEAGALKAPARGRFACIAPWNFPLAIFTGQVAAALAAGNAALAKPAPQTPRVGLRAVALLHAAGVPKTALACLPGGPEIGAALTSSPAIDGIAFTGSTRTAQTIHRTMADHLAPTAPLIAETGGLNAMIVDSTALPEQAIRDLVTSAFQSAGQRCSATRMLYVQDDIADAFLTMLIGAMAELRLGDPWNVSTDVGPVIDGVAHTQITGHIETARAEGRLLYQCPAPDAGHFIGPALISVEGIAALEQEVFGPVLHVARFKAGDMDAVVEAINTTGYGLTFGIHSRINARIEAVSRRAKAGNIYVNRNQIGAVVGSQPFGGEGLSGTGPKAGGPSYLKRFVKPGRRSVEHPHSAPRARLTDVQNRITSAQPEDTALSVITCPGPTGETNRLSQHPRGVVLCLGPTVSEAEQQAREAQAHGCGAVSVVPGGAEPYGVDGRLDPEDLKRLSGFHAVALFASDAELRPIRQALAARSGPIIPLLAENDMGLWCCTERHLCMDTTAAGGNASLLSESG